jgi:NAD(P)-dependent dehydrogenase (short-subunit alcohol dehydrogenase family)
MLSDIDPEQFDINARKTTFGPEKQYRNSKMLQIQFSKQLSRQLQGTNTQTVSLHPGRYFVWTIFCLDYCAFFACEKGRTINRLLRHLSLD